MNNTSLCIKALWRGILAFLLMAAASIVLLSAGWHLRDHAAHERQNAQQSLQKLQQTLAALKQSESDVREEAELFQALSLKGAVGPESRLEWSEAIKTAETQSNASKLEYTISARQALDDKASGPIAIYVSRSSLTAAFDHEEAFMQFFATLKEKSSALVRPNQCTLSIQSEDTTEKAPNLSGVAPGLNRLQANCSIDWITLDHTPTNVAKVAP